MKAFSALVLLTMAFSAFAAVPKAPDTVIRSSKDVTYRCDSYTSNKIDPNTRTITDNPEIKAKTIIVETKEGYIIRKGEAFQKQRVLINDLLGSASGMAGNPNTLLLKKEHGEGNVYFMTYLFEDSIGVQGQPGFVQGPNTGMIVMAACSVTK